MNKKYRVKLSVEERRGIMEVAEAADTPKTIRKRCNTIPKSSPFPGGGFRV